jgi:HlyD family type I secretion membrane fusion protein
MTTPTEDLIGDRRLVRVGFMTVLAAFGGFGGWAAVAPLNSAAVAHGEVKVESYKKTIQHREGGIVRDILVRDGSHVESGDPVMVLDDTSVRARWMQLMGQLYDQQATKARLMAERDNLKEPDFNHYLPRRDDPRVADVIKAQRNLFFARKQMYDGQIAVLRKRIDQLHREAEALQVEQVSKTSQLKLIYEEVGTVEMLMRKGLGLKPRLLSLKRDAARLEGERDDFGAQIARVQQTIAATELDIANVDYKRLDSVATGLEDAESKLRDVEQQLAQQDDQLKRTIIRAPQSGTVVGLKIHTRGAVVNAGEAIMDVVPRNDELIVQAQIKPEDIDRVHVGRAATVRLRTFLRGLTPPAHGTVTKVSADLIRDERNQNNTWYEAEIQLDPDSLKRLPGPLQPGMQSDVLIATGERTALEYMIEPLLQAMHVAMREK